MFSLIRCWVGLVPLVLVCLFASPNLRADYITQSVTLNQSNALKDGVAYGSVLIEAYDGVGAAGGGLSAGQVRLTYSADASLYATLAPTFGIDHVGFNTDLGFGSVSVTGPPGWKINSGKNLASFGKFTWGVDGSAKGGSRPNPVTILIGGLGADATVGHFLFGSEGSGKNPPTDGSVYFAMHVAGFTIQDGKDTSHWVGGSTLVEELPPPPGGQGDVQPTPEPGSALLGVVGAGCVWFGYRVRRRKLTANA